MAGNPDAKRNPSVRCNAVYKTRNNFNCNLTPSQAISLARNLLQKAQQILDRETDKGAVQIWNIGATSETLYCGFIEPRKGERRKTRTNG